FTVKNHLPDFTAAIRAKLDGREPPCTKKDYDRFVGCYDAVHGIGAAALGDALLEAYPDAKVILTPRDPDSWVESWNASVIPFHRRSLKWRSVWLASGGVERDFQLFREAAVVCWSNGHPFDPVEQRRFYIGYNQHIRNVVPKEKLLEFRPEQGWRPLCEFLDQPVPKDTHFPHATSRATLNNSLNAMWRRARKKGKRVALQGRSVFSTQEVLEVAKQAEEETVAKKGRKRSHTTSIDMEISAQEDEVLDNVHDTQLAGEEVQLDEQARVDHRRRNLTGKGEDVPNGPANESRCCSAVRTGVKRLCLRPVADRGENPLDGALVCVCVSSGAALASLDSTSRVDSREKVVVAATALCGEVDECSHGSVRKSAECRLPGLRTPRKDSGSYEPKKLKVNPMLSRPGRRRPLNLPLLLNLRAEEKEAVAETMMVAASATFKVLTTQGAHNLRLRPGESHLAGSGIVVGRLAGISPLNCFAQSQNVGGERYF
ncbi:hypothetical protein LTR02_018087, partial [Friedmanniomyces endolithicus]